MGRPKGSGNAFSQARAHEIWRNLITIHSFDWAKEFMRAFEMLDDPKDRITALKIVGDFFIPKPKQLEDTGSQGEGDVLMAEAVRLLKLTTEERIRKECLGQKSSSQSDQQYSQEPSAMALLEQK